MATYPETLTDGYYRVRKTWEDASSQIGAYRSLSNAKAKADENSGYYVFSDDGVKIYPEDELYRVRKSWSDASTQIGAYSSLASAKALADKNSGYFVFNNNGIALYPVPYYVTLTGSLTVYKTASSSGATSGTATKGTYTITEVDSPFGKLKSGAGYILLSGLEVNAASSSSSSTSSSTSTSTSSSSSTNTTSAATHAATVYNAAIGCKHVSGSYTWSTAMNAKKVNCSITASRVAYLMGLTAKDKLISHTTGVKTNITASKPTIAKSMSGYSNLDLDKCTVKWVGKTYANLSSTYKKAGCIYVYDSNIAVCAGDGSIYSCNNGSNQLSNGKYVKDKMTSGYCFTSPILVVIKPK